MLLCFSKRSPVVRNYKKKNSKMSQSWSPELRRRNRQDGRWHDGEEYARVGDEYRPKRISEEDSNCWEQEGYRRNRHSRDTYKKVEDDLYATESSKRYSFGVDVEDKHLPSEIATKAQVHSKKADRAHSTTEAFR